MYSLSEFESTSPSSPGKIFSVKLRGQKRIGGGDNLHGLIQFSRHRLISLRHPEVKRTESNREITRSSRSLKLTSILRTASAFPRLKQLHLFFPGTAQHLIHTKAVHVRKTI